MGKLRVTREIIGDNLYPSICVDEEIKENLGGKTVVSLKNLAIFKTDLEYLKWREQRNRDQFNHLGKMVGGAS
jgi:hypothetical protein